MTYQLHDLNWTRNAACADTPREVFFPDKPLGPRAGRDEWAEARNICNTCPVTTECLQFAQDTDTRHGMYGGLTPEQRFRRRRRLTVTPID